MNFDRPVFSPGPVLWVGVVLEGDEVMATIGKDLAVGAAGFGPSIPDALRELAGRLEREGVTLGPLALRPSLHLVKPPDE